MDFKKYILPFVVACMALPTYGEGRAWMTDLPDATKVRNISIPGSHDAATGNGFTTLSSIGAAFSGVTQSLSLSEQWDAGVRAFDLRPTYKSDADGKLKIYHGILETKLTMKDALQTIKSKLIENPQECAIILTRHESDSDDNSAEWPAAMADLMAEFEDYMVAFSPSLTLGDARGKMLLLSRDSFTSDFAGMIAGWTHSESFDDQKNATISLGRSRARLYVQDFYECQTVDRKNAAIKNMLDYSMANTDESTWIINHASGYVGSSGTNSNIKDLAAGTNKYLVDYLSQTELQGSTGIVLMDFAGVEKSGKTTVYGNELVESIINNNEYLKVPVDIDDSVTTGVSMAVSETEKTDQRIYNILGVVVGEGQDALAHLPAGIYIMNGKKLMIK